MKRSAAVAAWLLAALYYFYQYALRSSPGVMLPQLSEAFGVSAAGMASLISVFYYGYAPFSLVAGTAVDKFGARAVLPAGALMAGAGALLFGTGNLAAATAGRFLQGAGGVFALVGAIYIIGGNFPASRAATMVGATQMFGSSGGSAGQFIVGPMIAGGLPWNHFWTAMGVAGAFIAGSLLLLLPNDERKGPQQPQHDTVAALRLVLRNPQSWLCGLIAGLLLTPTTILNMIWGVRFLQEAHGFEYQEAVIRSATVSLGCIFGAPLLGFIADRLGRRKPVIIVAASVLLVCVGWSLFGRADVLPPYVLGLVAGTASGAAMLTYTVMREANPPQLSGTSTGVISFLNFTVSAVLGPVFGWIFQGVSQGRRIGVEQYQITFTPLLVGLGLAVLLTIGLLGETGPAAAARHWPADREQATAGSGL